MGGEFQYSVSEQCMLTSNGQNVPPAGDQNVHQELRED